MTVTLGSSGRARQTRLARRWSVRKFLHENGLSVVLLGLFAACWAAQCFTGLLVFNDEERDHGRPAISLREYVFSPHFLEATAENWESEFLQMSAFVWLTAFLFQKGSPESRSPSEPEEEEPVGKDSPWAARRGGLILKLYENSLAITLFLMFFCCWVLHAIGGARNYSQEQIEHGHNAVSVWQYVRTSQFWFESMQNWQSEFLSIGAMVLLSIFLRQKGSPESKPVAAPHWRNE